VIETRGILQNADRQLLWAGVALGAIIAFEVPLSFIPRDWLDSAAFWTAAFAAS
jgi:hypothetical protein